MLQDLRFVLRTHRKRPATTAVAVLMLALGLGANTVVFSLVEAFLLRPLELGDDDRLVRLHATQDIAGGERLRVTAGAFYNWRHRSRSLASLVAAADTGLTPRRWLSTGLGRSEFRRRDLLVGDRIGRP
jgi:hypothetical protein